MRERDDHVADRRQMGLGLLPAFRAGGAVAHMSHSELAGQGVDVRVAEHMAHQAHVLAHHDRAAVAHGDTRRLLAAVLQRAQAEIRETRNVAIGCPHAENTAFLVQRVMRELVFEARRFGRCDLLRSAHGFLRHGHPFVVPDGKCT